ncbi:hypothetical protein AX15_007408 [Amanita polypyramis BW_CC]|nr:hypothetical protein AX15_007408 [Amanita polypyramis BW_CC]
MGPPHNIIFVLLPTKVHPSKKQRACQRSSHVTTLKSSRPSRRLESTSSRPLTWLGLRPMVTGALPPARLPLVRREASLGISKKSSHVSTELPKLAVHVMAMRRALRHLRCVPLTPCFLSTTSAIMIFRLFSRKPPQSFESEPQTLQDNGQDAPSPDYVSHQVLPPPSPSPSPSAPSPQVTDPATLHSLIRSVPPQVFHTHSIDRLGPDNVDLLSPTILTALTSFFSTLVPPPKLHCVRCHKFYFEIENTDRSCLVPHDDDSTEVERVSLSRAKDLGLSSEYETLWGCCGRTVEGDGDMGPPDGWCYEGKHTTDIKRGRFRADSTPNDDKLVSCSRLRCPGTLLSPTPSSVPSQVARIARKRVRPEDEADIEDPLSQTDAEKERNPKRRRRRVKSTATGRKSQGIATTSETKIEEEQKMDVDVQAPRQKPRHRKPRTSTATDGNETSASAPPSTRPRRARRPKQSTSTSEKPNSTFSPSPLAKAETQPKPKNSNSSLKVLGPPNSVRSLSELSSLKSLSPGATRIVQRVAYVEVPRRPTMSPSQKTVVDTDKEPEKGDQSPQAQPQTQMQPQLSSHVSRVRPKTLVEVVDTSVDTERDT